MKKTISLLSLSLFLIVLAGCTHEKNADVEKNTAIKSKDSKIVESAVIESPPSEKEIIEVPAP